MKKIIIFLFLLNLSHCEKLKEWGRQNTLDKMNPKVNSNKEIQEWTERLALTEAELVELDNQIKKMVKKTRDAGSLSWRIAKAYMKVGNYELGSRYYTQAVKQNAEGKKETSLDSKPFDTTTAFLDKALIYKGIDEELLFETGLAYANSSKDRGWEKQRREIAVEIFQQLMKINSKDNRYPYQLALIYFDSSISSMALEGVDPSLVKRDTDIALKLIDLVVQKEPANIPAKFARANFYYRVGNIRVALDEYNSIKRQLEDLKKRGVIKESLDKNPSYKNVMKNIEVIEKSNAKF